MKTNGMSQVGTFTPDNLIAGNRHPVDIRHVVIKAGQKLERGTLLEEDAAESGKYVIRGTCMLPGGGSDAGADEDTESQAAETVGDEKTTDAEYILAEDIDASEEDTVGTVYCTGEFAENTLIVKDGYEITDRDRKILRNAGIFLTTIMM